MKIDPVTYEVLRHRLATIAEEGAAVLRNVSGSPSVAQSGDCNVALLTASGEGVVIGLSVSSHAISCIETTKHILREYGGNPGIHAGDMFFTNHPYIGTPHQTCGVMVAPIFLEERIVAWAGAGIHFGDVGGSCPGQVTIGARSIWDEAMPMPPVKIVDRGVLRRDLEADFLIRSRTSMQNAVDLKAMVGANNAIHRRVQGLAERYGAATLAAAFEQVIAATESKLRAILREIPDGTWHTENFVDYYDREINKVYRCRLKLTKTGDALEFDFSGSSKQAGAVINATLPATEGFVLRAMLGYFGFAVSQCPAAIQRVVRVVAEHGSIVHCKWPAGVCKGTTSVTQSVWQVATTCLGEMLLASEKYRARAIAVSRGHLLILDVLGTDQYGAPFSAVLQECSVSAGFGAAPDRDGIDTGGVTEPEVSIPNVESNEFRYPILYLYRSQRPDSAGDGLHRGGIGMRMAFMPHDVEALPEVMIHSHGVTLPSATGLAGGAPGALNVLAIKRRTDIAARLGAGAIPTSLDEIRGELETPAPFVHTTLGAHDVFESAGGGGGGFGDPLERPAEAVRVDIERGLLSESAARARYGLTDRERAALRAERTRTSVAVESRRLQCKCGHAGHTVAVREVAHEPPVAVRTRSGGPAAYVIREAFCPACWTRLDVRVTVPETEA